MGYYGLNGIERKTKAELVAMLRKESEWGAERNQHLLEANNRYLDRARTAEANIKIWKERAQKFQGERATLYDLLHGTPCEQIRHAQEVGDLRIQLEAANDALADLRTEVESDINAHLVEQTWLRMELAKAKDYLAKLKRIVVWWRWTWFIQFVAWAILFTGAVVRWLY